VDLAAPLRGIRGFGPKRLAVLAAEGFRTVGDLLLHLPFRYEDRSRFFPIERLAPGMRVTVVGTVVSARLLRTRVRGFTIFRAEICDGTGRLTCVWFNQPYLARVLKVGGEASLTGEVLAPERRDGPLRVRNPEFEILGEDPEGIHTGRIVPIYRRVGDLSPRRLRGILHALLRDLPEEIPDPLPGSLARRFALPPRPVALREVHFPSSGTDPDLLARGQTPAHRRLACS
jgi:ATP-dependent DNA helicase RecG